MAIKNHRASQDDSIMATNNSSIVSKRSVERLYLPQPHFFRYFVKKPQRRSPLINRGYWLRMYAIEHVIEEFLDEPSEKKKVVLNLGCGYDPLAFQWLSRHPDKCHHVTFVDVDFPELIARKLDVISQTPELRDLLNLPSTLFNGDTSVLRSEHYVALGCDLANTKRLSEALGNVVDLQSCLIICIAEVSMTYMNVAAADSLLRWASLCNDIRFCLLEQILPDGEDCPFAQKMIQHFINLRTPLQSIKTYPTLADQERRFRNAGWPSATARSLWDLWSDPSFLSSTQRIALNIVEPFDEWEEFSLFASHYFLLVASRTSTPKRSFNEEHSATSPDSRSLLIPVCPPFINPLLSLKPRFEKVSKSSAQKRFGAVLRISDQMIGHHGGLGHQSRLNSTDIYISGVAISAEASPPPLAVEPRMCHTITVLEGDRCLLVGGRQSPDCALSDCWLYKDETWARAADIPTPLYRHCATTVSLDAKTQSVLVCGGKSTAGKIINDWYLWHNSRGWTKVEVIGAQIRPRFGAVMTSIDVMHGLILGGMAEDGVVLTEVWKWSIHDLETGPHIKFAIHNRLAGPLAGHLSIICRFGACLTWSTTGLFLIGGISNHLLPQRLGIIRLCQNTSLGNHETTMLNPYPIDLTTKGHPPLLIGHSVIASGGSIVIAGGGAVCFSFGTYWNQCVWAFQIQGDDQTSKWTLHSTPGFIFRADLPEGHAHGKLPSTTSYARENHAVKEITRFRVEIAKNFEQIMSSSTPAILEGLDLGSCVTDWTLDYLETKIGPNRSVVVHEATNQHMDFQKKNFRYATKPFREFVKQIQGGSKQYLRTLAAEKPAVKPANFASDFPELQPDFKLPPQLGVVEQNAHSSPLRISGPVIMWLHYDVMANVLCQIQGSKRIILYPPSDVSHLDIPPGASSSDINVFDADVAINHPSVLQAHPQEALLNPGDVLYIPPLWFHTASPVGELSISINVFFRNLESGYAAGKDVYGNRDLQAYENGRRDIERITQAFAGLPREMGNFYLERLAGELYQKSQLHGNR